MDYLEDMIKYQGIANEMKKTRLTNSTIAVQLSRKNKRFQYKLMKSGARAAEYENAIQWLVTAGLIYQLYRAEQVMKPLDNYRDIDDFKIYLSDMGLLCAQKNIRPDDIFYMEQEMEDFKGGLTENYVACQLIGSGFRPCYWRNDKGTKEVDFVITLSGSLTPVEVKSAGNVRSDSLAEYRRLFQPAQAVRISEKNFGLENGIRSVPLYAVFCLQETAL